MKPPQLLLPLLLAVLLTACSSNPGTPSEADARAALEQQIEAGSQGCIKLVKFHKTSEQDLGRVLLVQASAEIEFLEDCKWPFDTRVIVLRIAQGETPNVRKGDHRTVNLTLQFHKTDQGWKVTK